MNFYASILEGKQVSIKEKPIQIDNPTNAADEIISFMNNFGYDEKSGGNVMGCVVLIGEDLIIGEITKKSLIREIGKTLEQGDNDDIQIKIYVENQEKGISTYIGKKDDYKLVNVFKNANYENVKGKALLSLMLGSYSVLEGKEKWVQADCFYEEEVISQLIEKAIKETGVAKEFLFGVSRGAARTTIMVAEVPEKVKDKYNGTSLLTKVYSFKEILDKIPYSNGKNFAFLTIEASDETECNIYITNLEGEDEVKPEKAKLPTFKGNNNTENFISLMNSFYPYIYDFLKNPKKYF